MERAHWIGITAGQRINSEERLADLDQLIETQEQAIALTLSVASKRVAARKLPRKEAEKELEKAIAPLQAELDSLRESREEVASWQAESAAAGERAAQLVELAERAHLRLNSLPLDRQAEFMDMLNVVVTIVGDAPQGRTGQPCALAAWFRERGRIVPILTDEAWGEIAPLTTYKSRGLDPRLVMRGILHKVRTDTPWKDVPTLFGRRAALQTYWTRWRESGFWEQAMDALASAEGTQLPGPGAPNLQMQCLMQPLTILESEGHPGDVARRG
ncbi:transposase [Streptomyces brevispora]|uniref:Transposase n=2 Tax=Streptomyces brevispora TaxID=887462 RepID=A0A561V3E8_9ACTN|nr:transposase [Streptomyces brevispora]